MARQLTHPLARMVLCVAAVLALLTLGQHVFAGAIDSLNKYAWSTNAGWVNLQPDNGGVTVYSDRVEGDAYGENIGWIRFKGTAQDGTAYGVSNDGCGNLAGYAWGTNVGWINFAPSPTGGSVDPVTVDPVTGEVSGYAYGENIGYVHFSGTAQDGTAYAVQVEAAADPTDSLDAAYENDVDAIIGGGRRPGPAVSTGMTMSDNAYAPFLNATGDCIILGHDGLTGITGADLPAGVVNRWARSWDFAVHDGGAPGGNVDIIFDFSDAGIAVIPAEPASDYVLLKRSVKTDPFVDITGVSEATVSISGDQVIFSGVDVNALGSFFTLGSTSGSLPVTLSYFLAAPDGDGVRFDWSTATETGNAGFNLYVETPEGRRQLNPTLIPSSVINAVEEQNYAYFAAGVQGDQFFIEQVDVDGGSELFGPYTLGVPTGARVDPGPDQKNERVYLPLILNR